MLKESNNIRIIGPIIFDVCGFFTKEIYDQLLLGNDDIIDELLIKHSFEVINYGKKVSEQVQERNSSAQ
jgi:hypothetical protein